MHDTAATSPPTLARCAYCGCERDRHTYNKRLDSQRCKTKVHPPGSGSCYGYIPEPDPFDTSEYHEGFIDGFLRAYEDTEEYGCTIRRAQIAYSKYLLDGGRTLPRQNVEGW